LFLALVVACGCAGGAPASPDGSPPADAGAEAGPLAPDASGCITSADCSARHFCARNSCVSAVAQVVGGAYHSCALHEDGTVSCWGLAESLSGGGAEVEPPVKVGGLIGVRALAAGPHGTCALTGARQVRCWGNQTFDVVKEDGAVLEEVNGVSLGLTFGCASNPQGTFCWGKNDLGQLGRPLDLEESPRALLAAPGPVRFLGTGQTVLAHDGGERLCAWGHNGTHEITSDDATLVYTTPQCGMLPDVVQLSVGADHACVRHAGGTFACWGERYYGQLGIGGTVDDTLDVPPHGAETAIAPGVASLVAGASHTCVLLTDGAVKCFGLNSKGQVGPGANTAAEEVRLPAPVTGFAGRVVALGAGSTAQHTCAILEDGRVQCWGSDAEGQLGDGVTARDPERFSHGPVSVQW
jgi:alpha-tubulin suppressor-like RCC1 family protein